MEAESTSYQSSPALIRTRLGIGKLPRYLGFSFEPMLQIVSGDVSIRGKQIEGPPGDFIMGRFDGGMMLVVFGCPSRRDGMN